MSYQTFVFKRYDFNAGKKQLDLHYSYDDQLDFTEVFKFDFDLVDYNPSTLDRAIQNLFFMAGVSYYKSYLAPEIKIEAGDLDEKSAQFFSKTYQRGLGEFFYVNKLDPRTPIVFPSTTTRIEPVQNSGQGMVVGIGGGKDSLVSVELLRDKAELVTWSVGHRAQLTPLIDKIGLPHLWVERQIDEKLIDKSALPGSYNGHVPISAILACAGSVVAILSGRRDIVVSNESSANEPTLAYKELEINHQYSKSIEFERDFQQLLGSHFEQSVRYYSLLRPFSELQIAEFFAKTGFDKYQAVFSSCNRAFTHKSTGMFWCGECPKCAFVYMILTPFVKQADLENLFGGKNLLLDLRLEPTYRQLLGIEGDKPLECVGEIKESRSAMQLDQQQYRELRKYSFDIPTTYDWRARSKHLIPPEVHQILETSLKNLDINR